MLDNARTRDDTFRPLADRLPTWFWFALGITGFAAEQIHQKKRFKIVQATFCPDGRGPYKCYAGRIGEVACEGKIDVGGYTKQRSNYMNKYLVVFFFLLLSANLGGCSRTALFEKAIAYERESAHLSVKTQDLSFGKVAYLSNNKSDKEAVVVMLHGFGADKDTWVRFARELGDNYRFIIPDLPGHGESSQDISFNYGIQEQAKRLNEFLSNINAEKVHIVANSMGGAVALRFTFMHPDTVKSLTLIDSLGAIKTPSDMDELTKVSGKNPMLEIGNSDDYKAMMNYAMVKPPYIPWFLIDVLAEAKIKRKDLEQKMLKDMVVDADQTAILAEIHVPTLIIWGKQDKVLHVDNAGLFHEKISGSRVVLLDETGHVPMVERAKETAQHFRGFLKDVAPNPDNVMKK